MLEVMLLDVRGCPREGRDGGVFEAMVRDGVVGRGFFWGLHGASVPRAHMAPVQIVGAGIQIV